MIIFIKPTCSFNIAISISHLKTHIGHKNSHSMCESEKHTDKETVKQLGNKAGQVRCYIWGKKRGGGLKKRRKVPSPTLASPHTPQKTLLGGLNEITPQKIELAGPTEGRNARN